MEIVVSAACAQDTRAAMTEMLAPIRARARAPDFMAVHPSAAHDVDAVRAIAAAVGLRALHGGTTCLGVMAHGRMVAEQGCGIGCFAVWDEDGDYASGLADIGDDAFDAGRLAAVRAIDAADRRGEAPDLVWLSAAPGCEERVIAGIESVVGANTPILGGSAADNEIAGRWQVFDGQRTAGHAVVVSVLFPSRPISTAYQNGYAPTDRSGVVTRSMGRTVYEIDGRPAGDLYAAWTGGVVPAPGESTRPILAESTLHPFGRAVASLSDVPFYLLVHPAAMHPDGALELFAEVAEGERLTMMTGSVDGLTGRAGRVAALAAERGHLAPGDIAGALVIYCGGCMMAVRDDMDRVASAVHAAVGGAPSLGIFTFGEQGTVLDGQNRHGNLMISCAAFAA